MTLSFKNFQVWCSTTRTGSRSDTHTIIIISRDAGISHGHDCILGQSVVLRSVLDWYVMSWIVFVVTHLNYPGLLSSWIVMYAFGRVIGQRWAPMSYCAGNTILQGIFCLGPCPFSFTQPIVHLDSQVWFIKWIPFSCPGLSALVCDVTMRF